MFLGRVTTMLAPLLRSVSPAPKSAEAAPNADELWLRERPCPGSEEDGDPPPAPKRWLLTPLPALFGSTLEAPVAVLHSSSITCCKNLTTASWRLLLASCRAELALEK